jgi:hypothetical protein
MLCFALFFAFFPREDQQRSGVTSKPFVAVVLGMSVCSLSSACTMAAIACVFLECLSHSTKFSQENKYPILANKTFGAPSQSEVLSPRVLCFGEKVVLMHISVLL